MRPNVSSTYPHLTVGITGADLSIASSNHSVKMLAYTVEMGEPICYPFVCWYRQSWKVKAVALYHRCTKWVTSAVSNVVRLYREGSLMRRFIRMSVVYRYISET